MNLNKLKNPGTRVILLLLSKEKGGLVKVQKALNAIGFHLVEDGDIGPITINAIKKANTKELHKAIENILLNKKTKSKTIPKWINFATKEIGVKEVPGEGNNPRVLQYHAVSGGFSSDSIPWCASFVNFVMIKSGYKGPSFPARAKSWLKFGKSSLKPVLGSIAVKSRKGGGHVGFVVGRDRSGKYVYILGGNQNDAVNVKKYRVSDFIDFRVPYNFVGNKLPIYKGVAGIAGKEA